jgi:hypothetical protein
MTGIFSSWLSGLFLDDVTFMTYTLKFSRLLLAFTHPINADSFSASRFSISLVFYSIYDNDIIMHKSLVKNVLSTAQVKA